MATGAVTLALRGAPRRAGATAALLAAAVVAGAALALGLRASDRSTTLVLGGGVFLLGVLALALARYDAAVALGFLLFAVVQFEPAPSDVVFAVVILVTVATGRFRLRATPFGLLVAVGVFAALNVLACMEAVAPGRAASFMAITLYLLAFALWTASWASSSERVRMLVRIYVVVAAISAAVGALALYVPIPGHSLLTAYTGTRARALFKDPNVFGPFLVPAVLIVVQELLHPRLLEWRRRTKLLVLAVLLAGVLVSYSRAAWLNVAVAAIVMGLVLALRRGGARHALALVALVATAAVAVGVAVTVTGQLGFLQERARLQSYDTQRFAAQSAGLGLGERHPIGVGPGQFELYEPISAHSTYVRALAEEGPIGFLALVSIMLGTLALALRNAAQGRQTFGISSTVLLAAWCGILANSVFIDTLHWRHLWLIAGLIWAAPRIQTSSYAGARSPT